MPLSSTLESLFKWLFLISLFIAGVAYFYKDKLPEPGYYDLGNLEAPKQTPTFQPVFTTEVNKQEYTINPKFAYELDGVIVSYNNSGGFGDIWHHKRWKDFINLRDLCVIWAGNVESGVYRSMTFSNDSWTCWASWPDAATGALFKMNALSNNHLLTDNDSIKTALMAAEPGDHIRLKGILAEYSNKANGFNRGTSITREDTGNGACETIYLDGFEIVKKANRKSRRLYAAAKWLSAIAGIGFAIMFVVAPVRNN
ncbi:MAG: hypothetical protein PHY16_01565 [Methylobacter sp.]|nr:hypothetical protein [Methylobacter sp.]